MTKAEIKKAESIPLRLTPLDPKEEKRAREMERELVAAGYAYADAVEVYTTSLKAKGPERADRVGVAMDHLGAAGAALLEAALVLRDVPAPYRP